MTDLPQPVSFTAAFEKFLDHLRSQKRSSATTIAYGSDLEQLQVHLDGHRITQATTIRTEHLETYVSYLASQNYTPKSISRKINSLKTFFKFLHNQQLVTQNPPPPPPPPPPRRPPPSPPAPPAWTSESVPSSNFSSKPESVSPSWPISTLKISKKPNFTSRPWKIIPPGTYS